MARKRNKKPVKNPITKAYKDESNNMSYYEIGDFIEIVNETPNKFDEYNVKVLLNKVVTELNQYNVVEYLAGVNLFFTCVNANKDWTLTDTHFCIFKGKFTQLNIPFNLIERVYVISY